MRRNLFLYLFIFSLLINVFTYVYFSNKSKYESGQMEITERNEKKTTDSLKSLKQKLEEANYFALENNENAIDYFAGRDIADISQKVRAGIDKLNQTPGGNPLVGYPAIGGKPFIINTTKILNHRWVIADFSNGSAWGEVVLKYFVDDKGEVTFETAESVLYTDTVN